MQLSESTLLLIITMSINATILLIISLSVYFKWYQISLCQCIQNMLCCGCHNSMRKEKQTKNKHINNRDHTEFKFNAYKTTETQVFVDEQSNMHFFDKKYLNQAAKENLQTQLQINTSVLDSLVAFYFCVVFYLYFILHVFFLCLHTTV